MTAWMPALDLRSTQAAPPALDGSSTCSQSVFQPAFGLLQTTVHTLTSLLTYTPHHTTPPHTHTHTHTTTHTHTLTHSLTQTHTHTLSLSHTHTHTNCVFTVWPTKHTKRNRRCTETQRTTCAALWTFTLWRKMVAVSRSPSLTFHTFSSKSR